MKMPIKASEALPWAQAFLADMQKGLNEAVRKNRERRRSWWQNDTIDNWDLVMAEMWRDRAQGMVDLLTLAGDREVILESKEMEWLSSYIVQ